MWYDAHLWLQTIRLFTNKAELLKQSQFRRTITRQTQYLISWSGYLRQRCSDAHRRVELWWRQKCSWLSDCVSGLTPSPPPQRSVTAQSVHHTVVSDAISVFLLPWQWNVNSDQPTFLNQERFPDFLTCFGFLKKCWWGSVTDKEAAIKWFSSGRSKRDVRLDNLTSYRSVLLLLLPGAWLLCLCEMDTIHPLYLSPDPLRFAG